MATPRLLRTVRLVSRNPSGMAAAGLSLFHVWLLAQRVAQPANLEPAVALRWLGAAGLLGAILASWRLGVPLTGGRRALALWACVLLLHVPGGLLEEARSGIPVPTVVALETPSLTAALLGLAGLSLALRAGWGARPAPFRASVRLRPAAGRLRRRDPVLLPGLSPRPPPL